MNRELVIISGLQQTELAVEFYTLFTRIWIIKKLVLIILVNLLDIDCQFYQLLPYFLDKKLTLPNYVIF